jgi:N,N'-diacetyllegionaminate synthase
MSEKVFIIAEAGVNHNGDIEIAKKLIDKAAEAGVDAVKFQSFNADKLVAKNASKAKYQIENTGNKEENQYEMIKKLELNYENHIELIEHCKKRNIMFLSSAFDLESIDLLIKLNIPLFKIPSGEIENVPYLRKIAKTGKNIILSTGMSEMEDIEFALEILKEAEATDIIVLHCNTEYPTPMEDVNLKAMLDIRDTFSVEVGYSDHTLGIEVPIAAVALGARVIEKHFTLDRQMEGPDHKASLEPDELKLMTTSIRNIELALGNGKKSLSKSESKNRPIARKSLVCCDDIKEGQYFTEKNIIALRPGNGTSPKLWDNIIGKKAKRNFSKDEMVEI